MQVIWRPWQFEGMVSADGQSMSGSFNANTAQGVFPVAFSATRKGDAQFDVAPVSVDEGGMELVGTWAQGPAALPLTSRRER